MTKSEAIIKIKLLKRWTHEGTFSRNRMTGESTYGSRWVEDPSADTVDIYEVLRIVEQIEE